MPDVTTNFSQTVHSAQGRSRRQTLEMVPGESDGWLRFPY